MASVKNRINRKLAAVFIALTLMLFVLFASIPSFIAIADGAELTETGKAAIAVLIFALVLWLTEAIPFHVTGLLVVFLLALLRVGRFVDIVETGFGSHIAVFMIGVLILSAFVNLTGLGKRITLFLLSCTGNKATTVILGFLVIGALLSMWLSNMAVAAMLIPLAQSVLKKENIVPKRSNFGRALMIACAWGPAIGGIGTPAGAGPNPLTIGFIGEMAGIDLSFMTWMAFGVPAAIALLVPAWLVLIRVFPPEIDRIGRASESRDTGSTARNPMSREERITVAIFVLTVAFWLTAPLFEKALHIDIPVSMTVVFTSALFFIPGITKIEWKAVEKEINWGSIILVLAGISLGMSLHSSGAAGWLSTLLLARIATFGTFVSILSVIAMVSLLKVVFSSNTVTAAIAVPLMIVLAESAGIGALGLALPAGITSSLGLILVTSSPTNVIPYAAGYFSIVDMAKAGVILTAIAVPIVAAVVYGVGLVVGM